MTEQEKILYWLVDCEAATLEHLAGLKGVPQPELRRHMEIAVQLSIMLKWGSYHGPRLKPEDVQKRLDDAIERAEKRFSVTI